MSQKYISKSDIIAGINILEIVREFSIEAEKVSSGNFNYRCRCPSKEHNGGYERTGSCYIDSLRNNFYCFGCHASSNCIDFYMLCTGVSFNEAIKKLENRFTIEPQNKEPHVEFNNFQILFEISNLFRKTMLEHKTDLKWINQLMKQVDLAILNLEVKNDVDSKALLKKINKTIQKRYEA